MFTLSFTSLRTLLICVPVIEYPWLLIWEGFLHIVHIIGTHLTLFIRAVVPFPLIPLANPYRPYRYGLGTYGPVIVVTSHPAYTRVPMVA